MKSKYIKSQNNEDKKNKTQYQRKLNHQNYHLYL